MTNIFLQQRPISTFECWISFPHPFVVDVGRTQPQTDAEHEAMSLYVQETSGVVVYVG